MSSKRIEIGRAVSAAFFVMLWLGGCATSDTVLPHYPNALQGTWMPESAGCPEPIPQDSEVLLSIEPHMSGQYENTTRPLSVQQISTDPPAWRILSIFSPGTGEYEGKEWIAYTLRDDRLTIGSAGAESIFIRCK